MAAAVALLLLAQGVGLRDFFRSRHRDVSYLDARGEPLSYRLFYYRDTYRALDAAIDSLRKQAAPGAIVASSMPHWVHLRSGLRAVKPPFERNAERALALLENVPVDYVIIDARSGSFTRVFALPALDLAGDRWVTVFADAGGEVEVRGRVAR
jgi:hypothetical protein